VGPRRERRTHLRSGSSSSKRVAETSGETSVELGCAPSHWIGRPARVVRREFPQRHGERPEARRLGPTWRRVEGDGAHFGCGRSHTQRYTDATSVTFAPSARLHGGTGQRDRERRSAPFDPRASVAA
jgi:hypothetical protein